MAELNPNATPVEDSIDPDGVGANRLRAVYDVGEGYKTPNV